MLGCPHRRHTTALCKGYRQGWLWGGGSAVCMITQGQSATLSVQNRTVFQAERRQWTSDRPRPNTTPWANRHPRALWAQPEYADGAHSDFLQQGRFSWNSDPGWAPISWQTCISTPTRHSILSSAVLSLAFPLPSMPCSPGWL